MDTQFVQTYPYKAFARAAYIKEKLELLSEFGIYPSYEQIDHMLGLTTQVQVDNYSIKLMMDNL